MPSAAGRHAKRQLAHSCDGRRRRAHEHARRVEGQPPGRVQAGPVAPGERDRRIVTVPSSYSGAAGSAWWRW